MGYCGLRYLLWATVRVTVRVLLQLRLQSRLGYSWLQGYSYSHIPTYAYSDAYAYSHSHSQGGFGYSYSLQSGLIDYVDYTQSSHSYTVLQSQL